MNEEVEQMIEEEEPLINENNLTKKINSLKDLTKRNFINMADKVMEDFDNIREELKCLHEENDLTKNAVANIQGEVRDLVYDVKQKIGGNSGKRINERTTRNSNQIEKENQEENRSPRRNYADTIRSKENYMSEQIQLKKPSNHYRSDIEEKITDMGTNYEFENRKIGNNKKYPEDEMKANNLIIYNMLESEKVEVENKIGDDTNILNDILEYLEVRNVDIKKVSRLGQRKNRDHTRPVLVKFANAEQKWAVLKKARYLNEDDRFFRIFFAKDMSKEELEMDINKRRELQERRQNGENIMIKNGQIIIRRKGRQLGDFIPQRYQQNM